MKLVTTGKVAGTLGTPAQVSTSATFDAIQHATIQADPDNTGRIAIGVDNTVNVTTKAGVWFLLIPGQLLPLSQYGGNVWSLKQLWFVPEVDGEGIFAGGAIG